MCIRDSPRKPVPHHSAGKLPDQEGRGWFLVVLLVSYPCHRHNTLNFLHARKKPAHAGLSFRWFEFLIYLCFLLRYTVFVFLPILHHFSASIHDAVKRIICHHGPKTCAFSDQLADAWDKCASSSENNSIGCLLYTSPSPRDRTRSRMPSSA